jgi:hypothetical protein
MAKLTGDIIKAGLHVWALGYNRNTRKDVPVELIVISGDAGSMGRLYVMPANAESDDKWLTKDPNTHQPVIYLGDSGVRPYNYDDRATQVFTTREEMEEAIALWGGKNPNFVTEDGMEWTLSGSL